MAKVDMASISKYSVKVLTRTYIAFNKAGGKEVAKKICTHLVFFVIGGKLFSAATAYKYKKESQIKDLLYKEALQKHNVVVGEGAYYSCSTNAFQSIGFLNQAYTSLH